MKFIGLSLVLSISFIILINSIYAEVLHTDIIKKFFPMTGMATEAAPTEGGGEVPVAETPQPATGGEGGGGGGETPQPTTGEGGGEVPVVVSPQEITVIPCPPLPPTGRQCPEGEYLVPLHDDRGCLVGNECRPAIRPVEGEVQIACSQNRPCPDGSNVPCHIENNNCICDQCPIREDRIPEGCRQEIDTESGFTKLVCEQSKICPADEQQRKLKDDCYNQGGNPVPFNDPSGCIFYDCKFGDKQKEEATPNPIYGYEECPSQEEVDFSIEKCKGVGMFGTISFEGGCRVAKCVKKMEEKCKIITAEMRMQIEGECEKKGLRAIKDFDEMGCPYFACAGEEFCKMDLPKEAFEECRMKGGEMVVKNDDKGCVIYSNCVKRGDGREIYVEPVENVPEPTELLAVAFKLEQLKIELDKLARQANDIADYYASVGEPDEHRFRRASDMFNDIKDKIDGIKNDLRERLEGLTIEDMEQIRFDIKSVKESLKDIVYVMLSNSDDVKEMVQVETERKAQRTILTPIFGEGEAVESKNCGTDGMCFDKAVRVCKPVTFMPDGRAGPVVTVKGLEGGACILHAEVEDPEGLYMDCQIKDYTSGISGPEDVMPFCEGPMREMYDKGGPKGPQAEPGGPQEFGGPGGCKSDKECKTYCEKNPEECLKWCRDNPGMCPTEAEQGLKQTMKGKSVCGNNLCEPDFGETVKNCYDDCIEGECGNGLCEEDYGESYDTCPTDCMRKVKSKNEFNDEKEFRRNAKNIGPVTTIDFESPLPDGESLHDRMRLSGDEYSFLGVTFYAPYQKYLQAFGPSKQFKPIGAVSLSPGPGPFEEGEGGTHDTLHIIFSTPVKAVGFYILDLSKPDYRESVTFYDEGGRIIDTMPLDNFVGFISASVGIQKVVIEEAANDDDDVAYDNIHFVKMEEVREIGGCECTWAAGSKEHPKGCPVLCSDYSYDKVECEAQTKNGCTWFGGKTEPVETVERAVQACVGCLNNGVCDVGECSECVDCLRR